jgi:hypothetical protein
VEVGEIPAQADVISIVEKAPAKSDPIIPVIAVILGILALTVFVGVVLKIKISDKRNAAVADAPEEPQNHYTERDHPDDHSDDRSHLDSAGQEKADE